MVSKYTVTILSNSEYNDPNIQTRLKPLRNSIFERIENYNELCTDFKKKVDSNGNAIWITGCKTYLKEAIRITNSLLSKQDIKNNGSAKRPFAHASYRPELDMIPFCESEQINIFQQFSH